MKNAGRYAVALGAALLVGSLAALVAVLIMGMAARLFFVGPGMPWPEAADPLVLCTGLMAFLVALVVVFREVSEKLRP